MNLRTATLGPGGATIGGTPVAAAPEAALSAARAAGLTELIVGLRPEASSIASDGEVGTLTLAVTLVEELGADAYVYGELEADRAADKSWVMRCDGRTVPTIGARVRVAVRGDAAHVFHPETGLRLG